MATVTRQTFITSVLITYTVAPLSLFDVILPRIHVYCPMLGLSFRHFHHFPDVIQCSLHILRPQYNVNFTNKTQLSVE